MNKNAILMIIALGVVVIAGTLVYQTTKKSPEDKIADSISGMADDIGDAAHDAVEQ